MTNYPEPVFLKETLSTNLYLSELCNKKKQPEFTCIYADYQTAGRGQRGNRWESESGKNLLYSFVVYPGFLEAKKQFLLSQITALALQETLSRYTDGITIKWPNDIYWKDKKLCGTLIENDLTGIYISRSISGTGVNLNQKSFLGSAPNPISFRQITGNQYDKKEILQQILEHTVKYYSLLKKGDVSEIILRYKQNLYRKEGFYPFKDAREIFMGHITDIKPSGELEVTTESGQIRTYLFKEIEYIL